MLPDTFPQIAHALGGSRRTRAARRSWRRRMAIVAGLALVLTASTLNGSQAGAAAAAPVKKLTVQKEPSVPPGPVRAASARPADPAAAAASKTVARLATPVVWPAAGEA